MTIFLLGVFVDWIDSVEIFLLDPTQLLRLILFNSTFLGELWSNQFKKKFIYLDLTISNKFITQLIIFFFNTSNLESCSLSGQLKDAVMKVKMELKTVKSAYRHSWHVVNNVEMAVVETLQRCGQGLGFVGPQKWVDKSEQTRNRGSSIIVKDHDSPNDMILSTFSISSHNLTFDFSKRRTILN